MGHSPRGAICGSINTINRQPCQNPAGSCPIVHRSPPTSQSLNPQGASRPSTINSGHRAGYPLSDETPPRMALMDSADRNAVLVAAENSSGYPQAKIIQDYWLVRYLYGISSRLPPDGWLRKTPNSKAARKGLTELDMSPVARWAFAGGTSLTAAWGIVERYSEDVDTNLFLADTHAVSKSSLVVARSRVAEWGTRHMGARRYSQGGGKIRISTVTAPDGTTFDTDAVVCAPDPDGMLTERRQVRSIIGRYLPALVDDYPELGGFELPVVVVPFTAVNKLDALYRRANNGDLAELVKRVRDVHDLGAIALSEHKDETRRLIPELASKMTVTFGPPLPRPESGYGACDPFRPGREPYERLRDAYHEMLPELLPAGTELLEYDEVMRQIAGLDGGSATTTR